MAQVTPPIVEMNEVLAYLSERGKLEWELALTKAQLVKALSPVTHAEPVPVESGHMPTPEPVGEPTPEPVPLSGEITVDNGGATPV